MASGAGEGAGVVEAKTAEGTAAVEGGIGKDKDGNVPLVLVTGATGYIANHVVKQLLEAGYRVRGTTRSLSNTEKMEQMKNLAKDPAHPLEMVAADLLDADCWPAIVKGCTYVLHTASPFSLNATEAELVKPAVQGTTTVLTACFYEPMVKRVVVTSSTASIAGGHKYVKGRTFTEEDWSNPDKCDPYYKSKVLAEKAAWDLVKAPPADATNTYELATVNPVLVMGPPLMKQGGESVSICAKMLKGEIAQIPDLQFGYVDVRDVAAAHLLAMTHEKAAGQRFLCCRGEHHMREMAGILAEEFNPHGFKVGTGKIGKAALWVAKWFVEDVAKMYPLVGKVEHYDGSKVTRLLGLKYRGIKESMLDMGHAVIKLGIVDDRSKGKVLSK